MNSTAKSARPSASSVTTTTDTAALLRRRGELCAQAQLAALEALPQDADDLRELKAIDEALRARGVDVHAA